MRTTQTTILILSLLATGGGQSVLAQQPPSNPATNAPTSEQAIPSAPNLAAVEETPAVNSESTNRTDGEKAGTENSRADTAQAESQKTDTGKQDKPENSGDGADAPAKPAPPKSKLPPNSSLFVEMGYADWGLNGNHTKFREYATPPNSLFLRDLRYAPLLKSPSQSAFLELRGIGQDDYLAAASGSWEYGATRFAVLTSRSRFFDPTPGEIPLSSWRTTAIDLRRAITRDFSLSFQARSLSQQLYFALPFQPFDQNTDYWNLIAGGKVGPGYARLELSNLHYADETGTLTNFNAQKVGISYLWNPTKSIEIEASGSHTGIRQPGLTESHVDTLGLDGDIALGAATDLAVSLQRRQVALPNVQNAYERNENVGAFSIAHRYRSWRAQLGLRLQNDDRVNGTQTYVDVPKWSTLDARLSGRLARNLRLSFRAYTQSLSNPPASVLDDPRTLYWTNRAFTQVKLESGLENLNGYAIFTYRSNRNYQRSTNVNTSQYTLGGGWQVNQRLSMFAEYHHENWTGRSDTTDFPALNNFLPDSDTGIVEVNWNLGRHSYVSLNYTGFAVYNDNPLLLQDGNTRGSFVTINTHYRFPAGYDLGLLIAPWSYHDTVAYPLNYNAAMVMVTGSARF